MNTAEYLIKQLEKLGVTDIFGVPGDYNFNILYAIENFPNVRWIGCTNELNAGYAADGYARQKGYGAIITTYGVGELSASNAIAGCFSENIPVIHVVGVPSTDILESGDLVHHTFQNNTPYAFFEAAKPITEAAAFLNRDNAKIEIDRLLKIFVKEKRPVYIAIPADIAEAEITDKEVDYSWSSDEDMLCAVIDKIADKINAAEKPVILADSLIKRYGSVTEFKNFVETTGIPVTNFMMGTGIVSADYEKYLGSYFAEFGNPIAKNYLENTDCLIAVGPVYSDFNSYGMKLPYNIDSHIAIYGTYTIVNGERFDNVKMSDVLEGIIKRISYRTFETEKPNIGYSKCAAPEGKLTSEYIYPRVQEFLQKNDVIFAEAGIIPHGFSQIKYPEGSDFNVQSLWCSIGWATPAAFGACIANKTSRIVLFTGEGAHQMSAMEIGNMLHYGVKPVVIVLNNGGYTIERILGRNPEDEFNDIIQIDYAKFVRSFNGDVWSTRVYTQDDFDKALRVTKMMNKLCYIEAVTDNMDMPELTKKYVESAKLSKTGTAFNNSVKKVKHIVQYSDANSDNSSFGTSVHLSLSDIEG